MVRDSLGWVRMRLLLMSEASARCSNFELLNLMFEKQHMDMEAVWIVVTFAEYVLLEKFLRTKVVLTWVVALPSTFCRSTGIIHMKIPSYLNVNLLHNFN